MKANLTTCRSCGQPVAKSASQCPHCGAAKSTAARWVAIAVVGLVLAIGLYAAVISPLMQKMDEMDQIQQGMIR